MTTISKLEEHGVPVSAATGPLKTRVVVYNIDQLHSLLDTGLNEQGREAHYQALFGGIATPADGGAKLAQKVAAHVIGNAPVSVQDRADTASAFPLTVHVVAAASPLTVNSRYDLSTPDGSPAIVSFSDVTLEQNGYFVCAGTPLIFTCTNLTRTGNSGSGAADFNILGRTGTTPSTPGTPIGPSQAAAGSSGECTSVGVAGNGGGPGNRGAVGTAGTAGSPASPSTASMQATITIQGVLTATTLTVYSQSGTGGRGGNGGAGGPGGRGGNGGNGVTCDCTGNAGGQGGDGGNGGVGGAGGNGGHGVDAAGNIVIKVPGQADVARVSYTTAPAPPGPPGTPGPGGAPGAGGDGGGAGKNNGGGTGGGTGAYGATGAQGQAGTITGKAAQITVMPA